MKESGMTDAQDHRDDLVDSEDRGALVRDRHLFDALQSSPLAKALAEKGADLELDPSDDLPREINLD
jgi:hypothetical protein